MVTLPAGTSRTGGPRCGTGSLEERRNSLLLLKHETLTVQPAAVFNITLKQVLKGNIRHQSSFHAQGSKRTHTKWENIKRCLT